MSSLFTIPTVVDFPTRPRTDGCQLYFDSFRILEQRLSFSTISFNGFAVHLYIQRTFGGQFLVGFSFLGYVQRAA